jgi:hypothetical protein
LSLQWKGYGAEELMYVHDANVAFSPLCQELFGEERCVMINGALYYKPT